MINLVFEIVVEWKVILINFVEGVRFLKIIKRLFIIYIFVEIELLNVVLVNELFRL